MDEVTLEILDVGQGNKKRKINFLDRTAVYMDDHPE